WSSWSSTATRSGSAPRPTPSSRAAPTAPTPCSGRSWPRPWSGPTGGRRDCRYPTSSLSRFRKLTEEVVFTGTLVTATRATFADPSGDTFERDVVHHPGAVVVVPVFDDGRVLLVRQFRAAVEADLLEVPAGKRDVDGEPV